MNKTIDKILKDLPQKPGVYQYFDDKGKLLYVGKAKNLRSRVRSYFTTSADLTPAKRRLVSRINDIKYTIVDNETEALLLETNLIKEHKSPYNVILKDDKYWQYIKIDYNSYWPQIYSIRRPEFKSQDRSVYFGPYTSGLAVKESLRLIKKIFPICLKTPKKKGAKPQPCFNYHLGRCLGPCVSATTPEEYGKVFEDIKKFIKGSRSQLTDKLEERMLSYSRTRHYEAACRIRNQIRALERLESRQKVVAASRENFDIVSLYQEGDLNVVNLFKIRQGKLLDKFNTLTKTKADNPAEIIEAFLAQYYTATTNLPKFIVTDQKLSVRKIIDIEIRQAHKGDKLKLVKMGTANAREYLKQQETFFDRISRHEKERQTGLAQLQKLLSLKSLPRRIETYDISNIQGQLAVGSMVVFIDGRPKKSEYRKFNIRLKQTPDDVHMIHETLCRRLSYIKDKNENFKDKPDLMVIDGGKTQLSSALRAMHESGLNLPMVSLAKKQEEIFMPGQSEPLVISRQSPALKILQYSRDEAHRFAISAYRQRHGKKLISSILDEIPGIGPKTQAKLIKKYKTTKAIKAADFDELKSEIGENKANIIRENL